MHLPRRLGPATTRLIVIAMLITLSVLALVSMGEGFKIFAHQQHHQGMSGRQLVERQVELASDVSVLPLSTTELAVPVDAVAVTATTTVISLETPVSSIAESGIDTIPEPISQEISAARNAPFANVASNVQNAAGLLVPDSSEILSALFAGGPDAVSSLLSDARQRTTTSSNTVASLSTGLRSSSLSATLVAAVQPSPALNNVGGFLISTTSMALIPLPSTLSIRPNVPIPLISTCPAVTSTAFIQVGCPNRLPGLDVVTVTETFLSTLFAFSTTKTELVAAFTVTSTAFQFISTCPVPQVISIAGFPYFQPTPQFPVSAPNFGSCSCGSSNHHHSDCPASDLSPVNKCSDTQLLCPECPGGYFCPPRGISPQQYPCGLGFPCSYCRQGYYCIPALEPTTSLGVNSAPTVPSSIIATMSTGPTSLLTLTRSSVTGQSLATRSILQSSSISLTDATILSETLSTSTNGPDLSSFSIAGSASLSGLSSDGIIPSSTLIPASTSLASSSVMGSDLLPGLSTSAVLSSTPTASAVVGASSSGRSELFPLSIITSLSSGTVSTGSPPILNQDSALTFSLNTASFLTVTSIPASMSVVLSVLASSSFGSSTGILSSSLSQLIPAPSSNIALVPTSSSVSGTSSSIFGSIPSTSSEIPSSTGIGLPALNPLRTLPPSSIGQSATNSQSSGQSSSTLSSVSSTGLGGVSVATPLSAPTSLTSSVGLANTGITLLLPSESRTSSAGSISALGLASRSTVPTSVITTSGQSIAGTASIFSTATSLLLPLTSGEPIISIPSVVSVPTASAVSAANLPPVPIPSISVPTAPVPVGNPLAEDVNSLLGGVNNAVSDLVDTVAGGASNIIQNTGNSVSDLLNTATGDLSSVVDGVTEAAGTLTDSITQSANSLLNDIASGTGNSDVASGITNLVDSINSGLSGLVGGVVSGSSNAAANLGNAAEGVVSSVTQDATSILSNTANSAGSVANSVAEPVANIISGASGLVESLPGPVTSDLIPDTVSQLLGSILDGNSGIGAGVSGINSLTGAQAVSQGLTDTASTNPLAAVLNGLSGSTSTSAGDLLGNLLGNTINNAQDPTALVDSLLISPLGNTGISPAANPATVTASDPMGILYAIINSATTALQPNNNPVNTVVGPLTGGAGVLTPAVVPSTDATELLNSIIGGTGSSPQATDNPAGASISSLAGSSSNTLANPASNALLNILSGNTGSILTNPPTNPASNALLNILSGNTGNVLANTPIVNNNPVAVPVQGPGVASTPLTNVVQPVTGNVAQGVTSDLLNPIIGSTGSSGILRSSSSRGLLGGLGLKRRQGPTMRGELVLGEWEDKCYESGDCSFVHQ